MRFLLLGPFSVVDGDRNVAVGRGNERALIALLALHANSVLSTDRIVDAMWGELPPATARDMVRLYVSRARSRIGDRLVTEATGYSLRTENGEVDAAELERLRRAGTDALAAGDAAAAVTFLREAVGLVRGEPLAEFAEFPFAREETPRLDELRLGTTEDYYDALLTAGEAAELVPALEQLVEENPYRERLRGQLMLALYRAGRQTDALARYQEGRRLFADEVGIEPSPHLRELERAILQHDVELTPARRVRRDGESAQGADSRRARHRPRRLIVALVALLVLGVGTAAVVLAQAGRPAGLASLPARSVGVVNPRSGVIEDAIRLPGMPVDLIGSAGRVWVAMGEPHAIGEVDPSSRTLAKTIPLPFGVIPRRIGPATGGIWIADSYSGSITRLDAGSRALGRPEKLFSGTRISFAGGPGTLWAAGGQRGVAVSLDPRSGTVIRRVPKLDAPYAIATGYGALWLAAANRAEVQSVRGTHIAQIAISSQPVAIATGRGAVWAVSSSDGKLWRIDPRQRDAVGSTDVGQYPTSVAVGNGSVWVGSTETRTLLRVSPRKSGVVVQKIHVGRPVRALAFYDGRLWVAAA